MGLLDSIEGEAASATGASGPLAAGILQMIQNQPGGLQGVVQNFHDKGLGGLVSAWVSTGPNPAITSDQVHQALGTDQVNALAAKVGINPAIAGPAIAALLPSIIDKLTPNGAVPEHSSMMDMATSMLKNFGTKAS